MCVVKKKPVLGGFMPGQSQTARLLDACNVLFRRKKEIILYHIRMYLRVL